MSLLSPTHDQNQAMLALMDWYHNPELPYIILGGYAGTGKTTVISWFRKLVYKQHPKKQIAFCAYTGKATQVLHNALRQNKALSPLDRVSTIHGLIYEAQTNKAANVMRWQKRKHVSADLIVVDEGSMVSEPIWKDLCSFGIPLLVVGDHGQLPPIDGVFSLMDSPHLCLEQIHRQAEGSPIIRLSLRARSQGSIEVGAYGPGVIKYHRQNPDIANIIELAISQWQEDHLWLVGMNHSRKKLNQQIRIQTYRTEDPNALGEPTVGDRVICVRNNWEEGIFNGLLGKLITLEPALDNRGVHHWYSAEIDLDDGRTYYGKISKHQFGADSTIREVPKLAYGEIGDLFDFGYALTVHKAQGSQASKVVVFEERNRHMTDADWARWLYTAVTRAQKELVIIGD